MFLPVHDVGVIIMIIIDKIGVRTHNLLNSIYGRVMNFKWKYCEFIKVIVRLFQCKGGEGKKKQ